MSYRTSALALASILTAAGTANAAFFSFASDSGPNASSNWTFTGSAATGNSFSLRQGVNTPGGLDVALNIDDNNGGLPTATLNVGFTANLSATWITSSAVGGFTLHNYAVTGSFSFVDRTNGAALLTGTIGGGSTAGNQSALLVVPGSATQWSTTGAVLGSDSLFSDNAVTWTATQAFLNFANANSINLANYGILPGSSVNGDDFAFDLSFINAGNQAVQLNGQSRLPNSAFNAESSFSGSAFNGIPTPGAASMLALGGLVLARRRRA